MYSLSTRENIAKTMHWFESIGFQCSFANRIWEPDCEINWAEMTWEGATFMLEPDDRDIISNTKDISIWFNIDSVEEIIQTLKSKNIAVNIEQETF